MKDFIFRNDTKLLFRNDIRTAVTEITKGHKVMFVYGGGSVKRNGCYDDIVQTLTDNGIPLAEYGDSSREFAKIQEGIRIAKENGITMIIGAGGASVMDSAKLIAFGFYHESDLWNYVKGKNTYGLERLPLALIPTYPSSGSENGLGAVSVDSRGIIMMGASLSTSSRLGIGKEEPFAYEIYELEFLPEKLFGSSYRRSLTSVFPRFLQAMGKHHADDIRKYYHDAFGFDSSIEESSRKLVELFEGFGVEMYYDGKITREQVDAIPCHTELSKEEVFDIINSLIR